MKNLTSLLKSMRRLRNGLVIACWLGIVGPVQALTLSLNGTSPQAVKPSWAHVTGTLTVADLPSIESSNGDVPWQLGITCANGTIPEYGTIYCPTIYVSSDGPYSFDLWVYQISGELTLTFSIDGDSIPLVIPYATITSLEARMVQSDTANTITAANYDQDVFIKAVFNPSSLPTGLSESDIGWGYPLEPITGGAWARLPASDPGHPTVEGFFGSVGVSLDVWKVKASIKEVEFHGAGSGEFAELFFDPVLNQPGRNYSPPHWSTTPHPDTGLLVHRVQYQAGSYLSCNTVFNVEPADFNLAIKIRSISSAYHFEEMSESPVMGRLDIADFQPRPEDILPNTAGFETPSFLWEFSIQESSYGNAGTSDHFIYRTLEPPSGKYITLVNLACVGTTAGTANVAWTELCAFFAGLGINRFDGTPMSFWNSANQATAAMGSSDLIRDCNGKCDAWADLFIQVLGVHGATAQPVIMKLKEEMTTRLF